METADINIMLLSSEGLDMLMTPCTPPYTHQTKAIDFRTQRGSGIVDMA